MKILRKRNLIIASILLVGMIGVGYGIISAHVHSDPFKVPTIVQLSALENPEPAISDTPDGDKIKIWQSGDNFISLNTYLIPEDITVSLPKERLGLNENSIYETVTLFDHINAVYYSRNSKAGDGQPVIQTVMWSMKTDLNYISFNLHFDGNFTKDEIIKITQSAIIEDLPYPKTSQQLLDLVDGKLHSEH